MITNSLEVIILVYILNEKDGLLQVITSILNLLQLPRVVVLDTCAMYHILLSLHFEVNVLQINKY